MLESLCQLFIGDQSHKGQEFTFWDTCCVPSILYVLVPPGIACQSGLHSDMPLTVSISEQVPVPQIVLSPGPHSSGPLKAGRETESSVLFLFLLKYFAYIASSLQTCGDSTLIILRDLSLGHIV